MQRDTPHASLLKVEENDEVMPLLMQTKRTTGLIKNVVW